MFYDRANLDFEISFSTQGEYVTDKKGAHLFSSNRSPWFPLGSLLFSFLDVDWKGIRSQACLLDKDFDYSSDSNDILPLINFYREKYQQLHAMHPFLHYVVFTKIEDNVEFLFDREFDKRSNAIDGEPKPINEERQFLHERFLSDICNFDKSPESIQYDLQDKSLKILIISYMRSMADLFDRYAKAANYFERVIAQTADRDQRPYKSLTPLQALYVLQEKQSEEYLPISYLQNRIEVNTRIINLDSTKTGNEKTDKNTFIRQMKNANLQLLPLYKSNDLIALCFTELQYMCSQDILLCKCKICNRYFIPFSKVSVYCDRLIEDTDSTCKQRGSVITFTQNLDDAKKLFRSEQNKHNMKCKRPNAYTREQYNQWQDDAKKLLKQVQSGKMTIDEFAEMIKGDKVKR